MQSIPEDSSQGAVRREWPLSFARTATPNWILWDAPFGRVGTEHPVDARSPRSGRLPLSASALERAGKRSPAALHLLARANTIPGEARLALNRFPTRCIRNYYLDRVLGAILPSCLLGREANYKRRNTTRLSKVEGLKSIVHL